MSTATEIVKDIEDYVGNDKYSNWYAGIASDAKARIFTDHKVDEKSGRWIYRTADSNAVARTAEDTLHKDGFDGGPGGGDSGTTRVYAYKKTTATVES